MKLHSRRATGNGGRVVFVHSVDVVQANASGVCDGYWLVGGADQQGWQTTSRRYLGLACLCDVQEVTGKATLAASFTVLHFQQSDVQFGIAIASELECPDNLY